MTTRTPADAKHRRRARETALRMTLYPALAVTLAVIVYLHPRTWETYTRIRWQRATTEAERARWFGKLWDQHASWPRLRRDLEARSLELERAKADTAILAWVAKGHLNAMMPALLRRIDLLKLVDWEHQPSALTHRASLRFCEALGEAQHFDRSVIYDYLRLAKQSGAFDLRPSHSRNLFDVRRRSQSIRYHPASLSFVDDHIRVLRKVILHGHNLNGRFHALVVLEGLINIRDNIPFYIALFQKQVPDPLYTLSAAPLAHPSRYNIPEDAVPVHLQKEAKRRLRDRRIEKRFSSAQEKPKRLQYELPPLP